MPIFPKVNQTNVAAKEKPFSLDFSSVWTCGFKWKALLEPYTEYVGKHWNVVANWAPPSVKLVTTKTRDRILLVWQTADIVPFPPLITCGNKLVVLDDDGVTGVLLWVWEMGRIREGGQAITKNERSLPSHTITDPDCSCVSLDVDLPPSHSSYCQLTIVTEVTYHSTQSVKLTSPQEERRKEQNP